MAPRHALSGTIQAQQTQLATSIAGSAVSVAASAGLLSLGAAGPIGAAIAAVGLLVSFLFTPDKNGQQKIAATHIVDQAAVYWKQNLDAWNSSPHTMANQAAALKNFDDIWNQVVQGCQGQNADLGPAGQRCVSERQRGGKYDDFAAFRDPIANAYIIDDPKNLPAVTTDPTAAASAAVASAASSIGLTEPQLLLIGLAALVVIAL